MIFKDRQEAGEQLAQLLEKKRVFGSGEAVVLSLLRGGAPVGAVVAERFSTPHLPLPAVKIGAPGNEESAIGALCLDKYYIDPRALAYFGLEVRQVDLQTIKAKEKMDRYIGLLNITPSIYRGTNGKTAILVDDGIASGATMHAAVLFARSLSPSRIIVCAPVASADFTPEQDVETAIPDVERRMSAVSRYYESFEPVGDRDVVGIFSRQPTK